MRVWIDLTNSPHVLVMRPVIETLRARGDEVLITARDFAQTLGLLERFQLDHTAIGHHRGGKLAAKGVGLVPALGRARALGERAQDRPRARPRLQRHLGRGEAAADPVRDGVRLRVGAPAARDQLPAGHARGRARRDPAGPPDAVRRDRGQVAAVRGPEGGVLPGGLRARPGGARRAGPGRRAAARGRAHAAGRLALPPLRRAGVHAGPAAPEGRAGRRVAADGRAAGRARARGRVHRPRAGDRRAVADRLRRPGDLRRRHDEPRGRRARHTGLDDVRRPARRRRRGADQLRPDAPARARRGRGVREARGGDAPSGSAGIRVSSRIFSCVSAASLRRDAQYTASDAPPAP